MERFLLSSQQERLRSLLKQHEQLLERRQQLEEERKRILARQLELTKNAQNLSRSEISKGNALCLTTILSIHNKMTWPLNQNILYLTR